MERETLDEVLRNGRPQEPISTAVERWLLPSLRTHVARSGLPSLVGVTIESIELEGTYPDTRYVARFQLLDGDTGDERAVGFTDAVWFSGDDGEVLEGDSLIAAVRMQPFEMMFESSLYVAVGHLRSSDPLVPRRLEHDEATGSEVTWIDLPISDLYATPELAALASWACDGRDGAEVLSCAKSGDQATVVVDGPWNRPRTVVCHQEDGQWHVIETNW